MASTAPAPRKRTLPAIKRNRASGETEMVSMNPVDSKNDPLSGYDFEAERVALGALIQQGDPDPRDPLYVRYERYLGNLSLLAARKEEHAEREQANTEVPVEEARKSRSIGALRPVDEDRMVLHTLDAMRLFLGVSPDPGAATKFGVPGARRAATALRQLFVLSGQDNPYADWALIETDERVAEIKALIEKTSEKHLKQLDDMKAKGLSYSLLEARSPQTVSLGYHSPYGYMMSTVVVMYDHCARVLKSAERRDVLTKKEVRETLYRLKHQIRSMFEAALKSQRVLMNENMLGLQRSDYLPQPAAKADQVKQKRLEAARGIFGVVPQDIFVGARSPRHSLRNERISGADVRLLESMALAQIDAEKAAATNGVLGEAAGNLID